MKVQRFESAEVLKCEGHAEVKAAGEISASVSGLLDVIDTFDRPGDASCAATFAGADAYADGCEDKPMKRIPKAGVYAAAGVFRARAEWSIFEAKAMGPNVGVAATASLASGAGAFVKAELASASASAGPFKATVGLSAETGASISPLHVEAKLLGTGFSIGKK
uniref:Uncharacterized protein n=1 Tax=Sparus aurata TaxID=8175 RepID=A0A671U8V2_SPAAU